MNTHIECQIASCHAAIPTQDQFEQWVEKALSGTKGSAQITLRIVDAEEMAQLNEHFRKKKGPTNVLSFSYDFPAHLAADVAGDIVLCAPVIANEAKQQGKSFTAHFAHMVVHGCLHLLGFDHTSAELAAIMEPKEIACLEKLGFSNPYGENKSL